MSLLKPIKNGRMYPGWWRWNVISGCEHGCSYCYLLAMQKRFGKDMMTPKFHEKMLNDNLGSGRKIFVCSSGDMWGDWVSGEWRGKVLRHCAEYPNNEYMFLTKNPDGYLLRTYSLCGLNCILGVTIETDLSTDEVSVAPDPLTRLEHLRTIRIMHPSDAKIMISVEPVMKFSADFWKRLETTEADVIYLGVDSGKNGLPEPTRDELIRLIIAVNEFTNLRLKKGIERIVGVDWLASWRGERGMVMERIPGDEIQIISEPTEPVPYEGRKP